MKCIEFIGVPASGKSFYKKKFEKKFNCISKQRLIINFFLKKRKNNFKNKFICYLIIFYYSNQFKYLRNFFKSKRQVFKLRNKINFSTTQSNSSFLRQFFNLNQFYEDIVCLAFKDLRINKDKLFILIDNEIKKINQNAVFKKRLYFWVIENFTSISLANKQKKNLNYLILDEGILHRIFLIYSLSKNNMRFLNEAIKLYRFKVDVYHVNVQIDILKKNIYLRNSTKDGYIYKQHKNISSEILQYNKFVKTLKKRNKVHTIFNKY
jgi:hypothetical protein